MTEDKKTSPCLYIGLGCGLAVLLAIGVMVAIGAFVAKKTKDLTESMTDPVARADKVAEVLGADEFPEGYYPVMAFSVPFVFDMAMLADQPPGPDGEPQEPKDSGFIYVESKIFGDQNQELIDYLDGTGEEPAFFQNISVEMDHDEPLRTGSFDIDGVTHNYATYRGEINTGSDGFEGIQVMTFVDCGDKKMRLGIWFGPDPQPEAEAAQLEVIGTPADEEAIAHFYENFDLCG